MLYRALIDMVVVTHLLWILFLITGAYWGRKHRAVMVVHAAGLAFAVASQMVGWYCPLTHLEVWLLAKQDTALAYPGSFLAHYAEKLVYINVAPAIIFVFTLVLVGVTAWIYRGVFKRAGHHDRGTSRS
jgi:hypothetical protein